MANNTWASRYWLHFDITSKNLGRGESVCCNNEAVLSFLRTFEVTAIEIKTKSQAEMRTKTAAVLILPVLLYLKCNRKKKILANKFL